MAADQPVDGVEAKAQVAQEAVAPDAAPATTVAAVAPAEQGATDVPELDSQVTLTLHLPERPVKDLEGIPNPESTLPVTLTPTDPLNEIRATLTELPDCYWLGSYVFRKAVRGDDGKPKRANGKSVLSDKLPEFTELHNIFDLQSDTPESVDLYVTHVPYNDAEARAHFIRFRDLLLNNSPDPNALTIDAGITVQDAVRHKQEWFKETNAITPPTTKQQKKKNAPKEEEEAQPKSDDLFAHWESSWPNLGTSSLIPEQARKPRSGPKFLRHLALAAWNPPPQQLRLQGNFFYIHAVTQENEVFYITASSNGFYISNTTASTFDPSPKQGAQLFQSLHDLFISVSPLFKQNLAALFNDPLTTRDLIAVLGTQTTHAAYPWLARRITHHTDPIRSQMAYLLTAGTTPETIDAGRDWNEDLQNARELPQDTIPDKQMRERVLTRINYDFTQAALRAVPRVAAGDVMAMNPTDPVDAHMYVTNNLFVSKGADGVGLYPHLGGDEAAHVAVSKDTSALSIVNTASVPGMSTLGTCLVDWKGERWVVQSIVPGLFRKHEDPPADEAEVAQLEAKAVERAAAALAEAGAVAKAEVAKAEGRRVEPVETAIDPFSLEETSIVYGGVDGPSKIRSDPAMHKLFGQVAKQLHLAEHSVQDEEGTTHALWGSVECKGLLGSDGRRYVLDLARMNPVDIEWIDHQIAGKALNTNKEIASKYPHKFTVLRVELLESYWSSRIREWLSEQKASLEAKTQAVEAAAEEDKSKALDELKVNPSDFKLAFNPDAFVEFRVPVKGTKQYQTKVLVCSEEDPSVAAVRAASKWLREQAVPRLVTEAAGGLLQAVDGIALTKHLHARGINVRYLGLIASLCAPENKDKMLEPVEPLDPGYQVFLNTLQRVCVLEMVQRGAKRVLRRVLKEARTDEQAAATSHFLNCLLGGARNIHPDAVHLSTPFDLLNDVPTWSKLTPASIATEVSDEVAKRFRYQLPENYLETAPKKQLLRAVCLANGIQLQLRDYEFEGNPGASEDKEESATNNKPAASSEGKKKKRRRAADKPKPNTLATATALAAASANTTFVPSDVLNLVPILKDSSPKTTQADDLMDTARLALARGERELGLNFMQQALASYEQTYGSIHADVARAYSDYAQVVHQFATARAMEEAKAQQAKAEGQEYDLPELPEPLAEMLSFGQALRFQQQAVTIAERTIGIDAQETLFYYTNMAVMERMCNNNEQALLCQARALELWNIIHGPEHPESIQTLNQVASTLNAIGRYEASVKINQLAYDTCKKLFGKDSYHTAQAAYVLAENYTYSQDIKTAVKYAREALHNFTERLGAEDEQTKAAHEFLEMLTRVAVNHAKQEKFLRENAAAIAAARAKSSSNGTNLQRNTVPRRGQTGRKDASAAESLSEEQAREMISNMDINNLVQYISGSDSDSQPKKSKGRNGKNRR